MEFFRTRKARELHEELGKRITRLGNQVGCMNAPEEWFTTSKSFNITDSYDNLAMVREICNECPVKNLCLEYAIEQQEDFGVFGGMTPGERRRLRRK
jgi:Transcription factor WhiB.